MIPPPTQADLERSAEADYAVCAVAPDTNETWNQFESLAAEALEPWIRRAHHAEARIAELEARITCLVSAIIHSVPLPSPSLPEE